MGAEGWASADGVKIRCKENWHIRMATESITQLCVSMLWHTA